MSTKQNIIFWVFFLVIIVIYLACCAKLLPEFIAVLPVAFTVFLLFRRTRRMLDVKHETT